MMICKNPDDPSPQWLPIAAGIQSRRNSITEETVEFYYMDGEGRAQQESATQSLSVSFTGHRCVGDEAQDHVLDELLESLENRSVGFLDYDSSIVGKPNARRGTATISISDYGSGAAFDRQSIAFTLHISSKIQRGTVTVNEGQVQFTPAG